MSCSQAAGSIASESIHRGQLTRFLARPRWQQIDFNAPLREALLQTEAARDPSCLSSTRRWPRRRASKPKTHLQHGESPATTEERTPLQQQKGGSQEVPQLHVRPVDHALGVSHPLANPALHEGVLRPERHPASDDRRVGRSLIRQCRCPRTPKLWCWEIRPTMPKSCGRRATNEDTLGSFRRTRNEFTKDQRAAPEIAFSSEGLGESVAQEDQASSVHRQVRQATATVQVACWAETETSRVLRLSGKTRGCAASAACSLFFRQ
jgi:hypothetical protein